mmetsp:Transcript_49727/g.100157  ORF Transcript_49727/g.100157 Transcript_49727/m.100157 type:complete len:204 (-) Transcript_49727:532-1143(-)
MARNRELVPTPLGPAMISAWPSRSTNERPVTRGSWLRGGRSVMPLSRRQISSLPSALPPLLLLEAPPFRTRASEGAAARSTANAGGNSCSSMAIGRATSRSKLSSTSGTQQSACSDLPSRRPSCSCLTRTACAPKFEIASSCEAISVMEVMSWLNSMAAWLIEPSFTSPSKNSGAMTSQGRKCKQTVIEVWNPWKAVDTKSRL